MPTIQILGFKDEFAAHIESGRKPHTIRKRRDKNPIKRGQTLHLYTGLRRPGTKLILATVCEDVCNISISRRACIMSGPRFMNRTERLDKDHREKFARADGFNSYAELVQFLGADTQTFKGVLIWWRSKEEIFADFLASVSMAMEDKEPGQTMGEIIAPTLDAYSPQTLRQIESQLGQLWAGIEWKRRHLEGEKPEAAAKAKKKPAAPIAIDQARR